MRMSSIVRAGPTSASAKRLPGVYLEQGARRSAPDLSTGVPAFIGVLASGEEDDAGDFGSPVLLDQAAWSSLEMRAGAGWADGHLGFAVRGFFENGGQRCYVTAVPEVNEDGLQAGLDALAPLDDFDLLCAPDWAGRAEALSLCADFCQARTCCFAILDAPFEFVAGIAPTLNSVNAAVYGPWLRVRGACPACDGAGILDRAPCGTCGGTGQGYVPPSGHIAGVYARTDAAVGVHKAPANERLEGVLDLRIRIDDEVQGALAESHVNSLRAFPGRGIRVFGARTCSADPVWEWVNVRRLFLTLTRWLTRTMAGAAFEPNDFRLWVRIRREVSAYLDDLYRAGALQGASAADAFYVKCDAETNPAAVRDAGLIVAEVGVAAARPNEIIVVRLVGGSSGSTAQVLPST